MSGGSDAMTAARVSLQAPATRQLAPAGRLQMYSRALLQDKVTLVALLFLLLLTISAVFAPFGCAI